MFTVMINGKDASESQGTTLISPLLVFSTVIPKNHFITKKQLFRLAGLRREVNTARN